MDEEATFLNRRTCYLYTLSHVGLNPRLRDVLPVARQLPLLTDL